MRVIIETGVFARPDSARLAHLFGLGLQGRHRIQAEDPHAPELQAWLRGLDKGMREEYERVLDAGFELDSREPSRHELWVAAVEALDLSRSPPRLPLPVALQLLSRPFRVVLEHRGADRAFLLCMCTEQQRDFLMRHEQQGYLEFESGNGLESMEERALELGTDPRQHSPLLTWLLFDSDALQKGKPSAQSEALHEVCKKAGLPHYQLSRRFIESYLPLRSLAGWVQLAPNREGREQRRERYEAFCRLKRPEQRHYYNLKKGFNGDRERIANGESSGDLFDDVSEAERLLLAHGLDRRLAELYDPPGQKIDEIDLRHDGGWAEMNPVISNLIAHIR